MTIQFLYPNPKQKEILDELEKINYVLSKPPSKQLQKNMRFVRNFTYSLFKITKKQPIKETFTPQLEEIKSEPFQIKEKLQPKILAPPPPPPPSVMVEKHPSQPISTKLKKTGNLLKYESIEPEMQDKDWKIFTKVKKTIKQQLEKNPNILEDKNFLINEIKKAATELKIKFSPDYINKIKYYLNKNIKGFGRIDPLINDNKVTSIICDSYDNISVVYNNENLATNIKFRTNQEMNNFILSLTERFNKKISEDNPSLEFSTDKFKISINYNPIMGSSFRINKL